MRVRSIASAACTLIVSASGPGRRNGEGPGEGPRTWEFRWQPAAATARCCGARSRITIVRRLAYWQSDDRLALAKYSVDTIPAPPACKIREEPELDERLGLALRHSFC